MASTAENIKMGTCKITLDGVDLGLTIGGVEAEVTTTTHETKVDQFGDTPATERIMGRSIVVRVPLAETTLENMAAIMPGSLMITDGTDPDKKKVEVRSGVGIDLLSTAKELILHPIEKPDADTSEDLVIPLANTAGGLQFAYKYDAERIYQCEFKGYPDSSKNGLLFIYGDKTATA